MKRMGLYYPRIDGFLHTKELHHGWLFCFVATLNQHKSSCVNSHITPTITGEILWPSTVLWHTLHTPAILINYFQHQTFAKNVWVAVLHLIKAAWMYIWYHPRYYWTIALVNLSYVFVTWSIHKECWWWCFLHILTVVAWLPGVRYKLFGLRDTVL